MTPKFLRMVAVAALCVASLGAPVQGTAYAVDPGPSITEPPDGFVGGDPYVQVMPVPLPDYYDTLTEDEKKAVATEVEVTTSAEFIPEPAEAQLSQPSESTMAVASAASVTCATASTYVRGSNTVWGTIYTYKMVVDWCYNGSRVTWYSPIREYPYVAYWPSVAGWEFTQNISRDNWMPGGTTWYVRNYLKGMFRYCPIRVGACLQTDYPWIYMDLNGAGGYKRTAGGYY